MNQLDNPLPCSFLIRADTGEQIQLNCSPYLIGREIGAVSYCMAESPRVSRRHAVFQMENGQWNIIDRNSTNHTYLNDRLLDPGVSCPLRDGDQIRLGTERFVFREGCA